MRNVGSELRFNADIFPILLASFRKAVIAHELAHVFFIALREPLHATPIRRENLVSCEYIARHLTQRWGFDQSGVCEWLERDLCAGIPQLRVNAGEDRMSEGEYKNRVEAQLLRWGMSRGCNTLQVAQDEHDRLLRQKEHFFRMGTLSDSEFAALPEESINLIEQIAHGTLTHSNLKT